MVTAPIQKIVTDKHVPGRRLCGKSSDELAASIPPPMECAWFTTFFSGQAPYL